MTSADIAWQRYVGGALAEDQVDATDIDGDGVAELVFVSSGKVVVKRANDSLVWASDPFGASRILGVFDLDGSAPREVVALGTNPPGLYVLSAFNGLQTWFQPLDNVAVEVLPVPTGTGVSLYVAAQQGPLSAWQFSSGVVDPATNYAWATPDGQRSVDLVVADVDADGAPELIRGRDRGFIAYDLATGAVRCEASDIVGGTNAPVYLPALSTADVNGDGRQEVILYDASRFDSEDVGVFVVACVGDPTALVPQVLWSQQWITDIDGVPGTNVGDKQLRFLVDAVADYDGKPGLEMVYSLWDKTSGWATVSRNATTGAQIATRVGQVLEGVGDFDEDGRAEALLREADGLGSLPTPFFSTMRLYDLHIGLFHDVGWALPNARAATLSSRTARLTTAGAGTVAACQNVNGVVDPSLEVYVYGDAPGQGADDPRPGRLLAVHAADGAVLGQTAFPTNTTGTVLSFASSIAAAGSEAESLVMLTDGTLRMFSSALAEFGNLQPGNFARMPIVASLDGTHNVILATDSNEALLALDGTKLQSGAPLQVFKFRDATQPEARGYASAPGLVCPDGAASNLVVRGHKIGAYEQQSVFAVDAAGNVAWWVDPGAGRTVGSFESFELLDDLDSAGAPEMFLTETTSAGTQELVVRRGEDGTSLAVLATAILFPGGGFLQGHASADINNDGKIDVVGVLRDGSIVGLDVSQAATGDPSLAFAPIFRADASNNGQVIVGALDSYPPFDLLRVNSQDAFGPYERHDLQGNLVASFQAPHPSFPSSDANLVALVQHAGTSDQFDFVWAGMAGDALGRVSLVDGEAFTETWSVVLSAGKSYPLQNDPGGRSALYGPIAADVDGDGSDEIVVGSDDGYLYVLRSTDGTLAFSRRLYGPVVHVIAADIDKDPEIELVVALGDGRLIGLDTKAKYTFDDVAPPQDAGVDALPDVVEDAGPDVLPDAEQDAAQDVSDDAQEADGEAGGSGGTGGSDAAADGDAGGGADAQAEAQADASTDDAAPSAPAVAPESSGCGCRTANLPASGSKLFALAGIALAMLSRRRRSIAR